ncbi:hypothetical protein AYJ54_16860 [Bradyrhizobium centrolobii]|uniref:Uncharacterized protein n=1 Tax=Bradyrhizobium centrolobii TaxID=1505087 RepID=A0A176YNN5_9BRAD|nr:hypothetical protein [Bradyrhizobium centrolobii]OAF07772.1 hypothetical protein AYJ54_16860 [Bradyrhizobium centrolobii]
MLALFGAKFAAADAARERHCKFNVRALAAMVAAGVLSACVPATVPLVGRDPADPAAKVAGVGYRSTIAPYTSMRPSTPAPWRERNDTVAPQPKSDQ